MVVFCRLEETVRSVRVGYGVGCTPQKKWLEASNGGLADEFPFERGDFQVPCLFSGGDMSQ